MKIFKEVLDFCNEFTFYDHYNIERVLEINRVCDCLISVLSENDFIRADKIIRLVVKTDDISVVVTEGNVENLVQETK